MSSQSDLHKPVKAYVPTKPLMTEEEIYQNYVLRHACYVRLQEQSSLLSQFSLNTWIEINGKGCFAVHADMFGAGDCFKSEWPGETRGHLFYLRDVL